MLLLSLLVVQADKSCTAPTTSAYWRRNSTESLNEEGSAVFVQALCARGITAFRFVDRSSFLAQVLCHETHSVGFRAQTRCGFRFCVGFREQTRCEFFERAATRSLARSLCKQIRREMRCTSIRSTVGLDYGVLSVKSKKTLNIIHHTGTGFVAFESITLFVLR